MRYIKLFENTFAQRMGSKLYLEFDSTHIGFNSMDNFRRGRQNITPSEYQIKKAIDVVEDILGDKIHHHIYYPEFRQIYIYFWSNKPSMTFKEHSSSNKKLIIISFYIDEWIFVSIIDKGGFGLIPIEKHYVCDDFVGLEELINDKMEYLINK